MITQMQSEAKIELTGRGAPSTTLIRVNQLEKGRPLFLKSAQMSLQCIKTKSGILTRHERRPSFGEKTPQPH